jgi:hypothetical protein
MSEPLPDGKLVVRGEDGNPVIHILQGRQGYKVIAGMPLIRVWDHKRTFLIHYDELISLELSNEPRRER